MFRAFRQLSKYNNNSFNGITTFQLRRNTSSNYSCSDLIFLDRRKAEHEWKKAEIEWKQAEIEWKKAEIEWNNDDKHEQQRIFDYEGGTRIISKK